MCDTKKLVLNTKKLILNISKIVLNIIFSVCDNKNFKTQSKKFSERALKK